MPLAPTFGNSGAAVVHSNDAVTIIDYPSYVSIAEWSGAQATGFGVSPILSWPPVGTGVAQAYGTGTQDDSKTINAALLAIGVGGGMQTLYFPPGTYLVSDTKIVNAYNVPVVLAPGASVTGTYAAQLLNQGAPYKVRAVITGITTSTTYTGTGTNTLTMGSNAILFGTQDGITTLAVGDAVFLQGGTISACAITAADTGPWLISALGTASTKGVLVRPSWWQTGYKIQPLQTITVGPEGVLFGGATWSSWAGTPIGAQKVVGTDDPLFYPDQVSMTATLVSSSYTLNTIPFRTFAGTTGQGNTTIVATLQAVGGTTTSTVGYGVIAAPTAGYLGTATAAVVAQASGMTKNGTSDTSVVSIVVTNRTAQ